MLFDPNGPYTSDPVTNDEVTANDAVPCNDPVNTPTNDPVNEPVLYEELNARNELESNPMLELLFNMRVSNEALALRKLLLNIPMLELLLSILVSKDALALRKLELKIPTLLLTFNILESNEAEAIKYDAVKLLYDDVSKKAAESYPSKKSAFTAYEALVELLAYEALNTDIEDV